MFKSKSLLLFVATILLIACLCCFAVTADESEGLSFTKDEMLITESAFSKLPATYEATVKFPEDTTSGTRGGVIFGDFKNMTTACVSFEIHKNGNPRLYFIDADKKTYSFIFDKVNVYTGDWVNIAIVKDSTAETITCYIDGIAKQTLTGATPATLTLKSQMCIGGDNRDGNEQYFKGSIKNVTLYSDVRTADEIKTDASGSYGTDNLIGSYDITANAKSAADKNGIGPKFASSNPWFEKEPAKDYDYSFAVVGDTQSLAYYYPTELGKLYTWIVDNVEDKKIEYVFGVGDITDKDTRNEWTLAKKVITKLNGVVPYSLVRGNHDSVEMMNKFFPYSEFGSKFTGSYDESILNTYHAFEVGDIKYLLVNLDMGPSDKVLEWANEVVSQYPDHNVIVTTHVYLYHDGTTLDSGDNAPASKCGGINDGDDIWDKFIKKHKNIVLVLSGHDPYDKIVRTQKRGDNGNVVTQMLIDPQHTDKKYNGAGLVAMLYFSDNGSHIDVEYISTANGMHFLEENQFGIDIAVVEAAAKPEEPKAPESSSSETTAAPTPDTTAPVQNNNNDGGEISPAWFLLIVPVAAVIIIVIVLKKKKD